MTNRLQDTPYIVGASVTSLGGFAEQPCDGCPHILGQHLANLSGCGDCDCRGFDGTVRAPALWDLPPLEADKQGDPTIADCVWRSWR